MDPTLPAQMASFVWGTVAPLLLAGTVGLLMWWKTLIQTSSA
jgi:hypothetical protein